MKKILIKWLPIAAAVMLATACSKDDSIVNSSNNDKYVSVPYSIMVNNGTSLSKINYSDADGAIGKVVAREFQPSDVDNITMTVTGYGINSSELTLKSTNIGGKDVYYFAGNINVSSQFLQNFKDGKLTLKGSFTTGPEGASITESSESLLHLVTNCTHEYVASFVSNADGLSLVDQNAYLSLFRINYSDNNIYFEIDGHTKTLPLNTDYKLWVAVDGGSNLFIPQFNIQNKTAEPGRIYNLNRVGASGITLNETSLTLSNKYGDNNYQFQLTATVLPNNCTNPKVEWHSSNYSVAYVDENGLVYVLYNKPGTATITAITTDGTEVSAECTVTVTGD